MTDIPTELPKWIADLLLDFKDYDLGRMLHDYNNVWDKKRCRRSIKNRTHKGNEHYFAPKYKTKVLVNGKWKYTYD